MKVVACWPRFGPYHVARLGAVAASAAFDLVGLETAPSDETYSWDSTEVASQPWTKRIVGQEGIERTLDQLQPDVLVVNGWGFADSRRALAWAARNQTSTCVFSDSRVSDKRRRASLEWLKRRILRLCDTALAAGPEHGAYLESMGMPPERIFYGYDVVDNSYFQRAVHAARANARTRQDRGLPERPYFLTLGRFVPKKNFLGLLRAYEIYRSTTDPQSAWSLAIAGDGPQREEIQRAIAHSQFSKSIVVLPFQQYHDLPTVYAHASCFVIASIENEQWGLVVNEAMACGLPVLASGQCGCASSLIRDGENGFLLDPADEPGMAHTMARFAALSDHARAAMERRSEEIIADWSLERFAQSFIAAANLATSRPRTRRWRDRLFAHALSAAKR